MDFSIAFSALQYWIKIPATANQPITQNAITAMLNKMPNSVIIGVYILSKPGKNSNKTRNVKIYGLKQHNFSII